MNEYPSLMYEKARKNKVIDACIASIFRKNGVPQKSKLGWYCRTNKKRYGKKAMPIFKKLSKVGFTEWEEKYKDGSVRRTVERGICTTQSKALTKYSTGYSYTGRLPGRICCLLGVSIFC